MNKYSLIQYAYEELSNQEQIDLDFALKNTGQSLNLYRTATASPVTIKECVKNAKKFIRENK